MLVMYEEECEELVQQHLPDLSEESIFITSEFDSIAVYYSGNIIVTLLAKTLRTGPIVVDMGDGELLAFLLELSRLGSGVKRDRNGVRWYFTAEEV
jgi:hypothetical protein